MAIELRNSLKEISEDFELVRLKISKCAKHPRDAKLEALLDEVGALKDWADVFASRLARISAAAKRLTPN